MLFLYMVHPYHYKYVLNTSNMFKKKLGAFSLEKHTLSRATEHQTQENNIIGFHNF